MNRTRVVVAAALAAGALDACSGDDSNFVRGRGLTISSMPASAQAQVYEAAARASFDVDNTPLLLDRRRLPRTIGLAAEDSMAGDVAAELRRRGSIQGTCEPPLEGKPGSPICTAAAPGYVLRFSPVFALEGDSVQVYMYAQKYDTPATGRTEPLRFERAYQVVKRGERWVAALEGHVSKEVRGEKR